MYDQKQYESTLRFFDACAIAGVNKKWAKSVKDFVVNYVEEQEENLCQTALAQPYDQEKEYLQQEFAECHKAYLAEARKSYLYSDALNVMRNDVQSTIKLIEEIIADAPQFGDIHSKRLSIVRKLLSDLRFSSDKTHANANDGFGF